MARIIALVPILLVAVGAASAVDYAKKETDLRKMLFADYDKNARPSEQVNITVNGISVLKWDMLVEENAFKLDGWLKTQWIDPRLAWEGKGYSDITQLVIPQNMVWLPDLTVYNGHNMLTIGSHASGAVNTIVYSSGLVMFIPPAELVGSCIADVTYFPHDVHNCTIKVGSWVHHGFHLALQVTEDTLEFEDVFSGACQSECSHEEVEAGLCKPDCPVEWTMQSHSLIKESKYYECCPEPYMSFKVSVMVKRTSPGLNYTIKIPAIGLSLLCLAIFLLPPGAGEKMTLGALLLLCDLLFLGQVKDVLNVAPTHTPLIVRLIGEQMVLLVASVLLSAWVIRTSRGPHSAALPTFIKNPLLSLAPLLGLENYKNQAIKRMVNNGKESEVEIGDSNTLTPIYKSDTGTTQADWLLFAAFVDRLMFLGYLIIIVISLLAFSSVL